MVKKFSAGQMRPPLHVLSRPSNRDTPILCMPQNGFGLIASHAREPCQEIIEPGTVFQILEECLHRNARPFENPGAAHFARNPLDRRTTHPLNLNPRLEMLKQV